VFAIDTVVIGAGQAGLAVSRCLTDAGVEHVVLERGRVGERWLSQRWDSLRLLTPNWATRLPAWTYTGPDPDGYMAAAEFAEYLASYAASFTAPVRAGTTVTSVERSCGQFIVRTDQGCWRTDNVVLATGWCDQPRIPTVARKLSPAITQLTASSYRNPAALPPGGVLIVGASASGVQLADELVRTGRQVTLAVGRHRRLPRRYRGRDIWQWLDRIGTFRRTIDDAAHPAAARRDASLQLVGRAQPEVDLPALRRLGVTLTSRLTGASDSQVYFADDLASTTSDADCRMRRVLARTDEHITRRGIPAPEAAPIPPADAPELQAQQVDLFQVGIGTVLWATGYTRSYPWLKVPALGRDREIIQRRGTTPIPGLYVVGQRFQYRRDSDFIDGVRHDAATIVWQIAHPRLECVLPAS
jgi:putative flavoprotein involved in K+ transport